MTFDGSAVAGRGAVTWTGTHDGVPPSDDARRGAPGARQTFTTVAASVKFY